MHRRLKDQMDALTAQIAKILTSEKTYQMAEVARLHSSSGDEGGASASATSITSSPASNADATTSPELVAEVIQIPASPIMKSRKSKAVHAAAEQQTREKFTAHDWPNSIPMAAI